MNPNTALLVVDVQPTFCEGGELPVTGGNDVAAAIAGYLRRRGGDYGLVVTSQDWHVKPVDHFAEQPDFEQTWPPHGLAGSPNAQLHPALAAVLPDLPRTVGVRKGEYAAAYSAFEGQTGADPAAAIPGHPDERDPGPDGAGRFLADVLAAAGVTDVDVCGIAESHCVRSTALDALAAGLRVRLLADLTVPVTPAGGQAARQAIRDGGGTVIQSADS